jgi:hypothetical protein
MNVFCLAELRTRQRGTAADLVEYERAAAREAARKAGRNMVMDGRGGVEDTEVEDGFGVVEKLAIQSSFKMQEPLLSCISHVIFVFNSSR